MSTEDLYKRVTDLEIKMKKLESWQKKFDEESSYAESIVSRLSDDLHDFKTASEIYEILQKKISWAILDKLGVRREPHKPVIRTRKWKLGRPKGIAFHYTGGPSGLKTIHWFNDPALGNEVSSCQVIIFDRVTKDIIGEMWSDPKIVSMDMKTLFPVPTIVLADFKWSTWCTNWMNEYCVGIENRNIGPKWGATKLEEKLLKKSFTTVDRPIRSYETFSREQIICNLNLGRLIHGWTDKQLDPDYIVSHHMISCEKRDVGPAFPFCDLRKNIFTNTPIWELSFLDNYFWAPDTDKTLEDVFEHTKDSREGELFESQFLFQSGINLSSKTLRSIDVESATRLLRKLGYNCSDNSIESTTMFTKWFQRSTQYDTNPKQHLAIDGVPGPKTILALQMRLKEVGQVF